MYTNFDINRPITYKGYFSKVQHWAKYREKITKTDYGMNHQPFKQTCIQSLVGIDPQLWRR